MAVTKFLQEPKKLEMQLYKKTKKGVDLRQTHVPFSGSPHKHPYDHNKFLLVADPYSSSVFYDFESKDVEFAEELPSIVNLDGETVNMVLIWVKKDSIGLRCSPFIVRDTTAGSRR